MVILGGSMHSWKLYSVNGKSIVALKEGMNWFAFFFGGAWAFFHRLYWQGAVGVLLAILLNGFLEFHPFLGLVLGLLVSSIYGFYANVWRGKSLLKKGYVNDQTLRAKSSRDAIVEYKRIVEGLSIGRGF
ncbi:hypothetical protein C2134_17920 [Chromobacterium sinusclupearum]|uniref:DUF2628 domain-containing protein n=4 Tax=Chromobacteriaceae TaxID=1499392 RepID=A0A2K4MJL5_9NEIS|nr:DUF2628 domain-containing protein [Chromobacterium amazonense]MDQ4542076.1 DUF2628 domain-containing protein [Chromobacterium amazonense]POA97258.1 hypothetical protein C2134_17920 [Chromobacterium sinusclupearum]